jgi:hypothetical protein
MVRSSSRCIESSLHPVTDKPDIPAHARSAGGIQRFWSAAGDPPLPRVGRAQGLHVWDTAGRRYIDVTSGPVAVNLGHGNERVLRAMREQSSRVCFAYPSAFESESNLRLGERLAAGGHGPGARVFCVERIGGGGKVSAVRAALCARERAGGTLQSDQPQSLVSRQHARHDGACGRSGIRRVFAARTDGGPRSGTVELPSPRGHGCGRLCRAVCASPAR